MELFVFDNSFMLIFNMTVSNPGALHNLRAKSLLGGMNVPTEFILKTETDQ